MRKDRIRGTTLRFTFDDGQMAGKTFEHRFDPDGTVSFRAVGGNGGGAKADGTPAAKYEVASVRGDVCAVSYLSSAGYTLTTILDFATMKLVAFSSNEKMLSIQHGSFEEASAATEAKPANAAQPHAARH